MYYKDLLFNTEHVDNIKDLDKLKYIFLESIKGSNLKYKRYTGSPLRYAGGKSLMVGYIVEQLPSNISRVVSPFLGGGSVEVCLSKELNLEVYGYDIFCILINYWYHQIHHPLELYNILKDLKPDKQTYKEIKNKLKKHWEREEQLPDLELAAYYFFNHNLSYGPGFLGWLSSVYSNPKTYQNMIEKVKNFKVQNFHVKCLSFEESIPQHPNDFLYLDPPYYIGEGSGLFKGIYPQRNFPIHHNNFPHEKLRDLLHSHKGQFILSYNDCEVIREWYKDFKIISIDIPYTMGQGETRIGKNRKDKSQSYTKKGTELLIIKI